MITTEDTSVQDDVKHRFEWDAKNFDAIYRLERSPFSRWFNKTFRKAVFDRYDLAFTHAGDVTGKAILDIGCGPGIYSADFARRGARRVLGVDFSSNMLDIARAEARQHGVEGVCEFRQADFTVAQLTETFDVTIAMGVFDYLREPQPFLKKMADVTRGTVICSFPGHSTVRKLARRMRYKLTRRGTVFFYAEEDVARLAKGAGFQSYEIVPLRSSGTGFVLVGKT